MLAVRDLFETDGESRTELPGNITRHPIGGEVSEDVNVLRTVRPDVLILHASIITSRQKWFRGQIDVYSPMAAAIESEFNE